MVTFGTMERCLRYSEQLAFDPVLQLLVDKKRKPFGLAHINFIACKQFKMIEAHLYQTMLFAQMKQLSIKTQQ